MPIAYSYFFESLISYLLGKAEGCPNLQHCHPAPDRAASRSSILSVAFFGTMMHLRGASLSQRRLFWPEEFMFSSEALNFWMPMS